MRFLFVCMSIVVIVVPSVPMFKTLLETSQLICRGWKVSENYTMFVCLFVPMFEILLNKKNHLMCKGWKVWENYATPPSCFLGCCWTQASNVLAVQFTN